MQMLRLHPQAVALDDLRALCERYGPTNRFDPIHRETS
jgi:hypothetical protein